MAPTSGISVLRELRESGLAKDSVIVMLSGITDIKAINEGYQLGASTFLIKPIKPDDILEMLNGMKNKIRVEEQPSGYLLEWINSHHATPSAGEPPSRTVSLSA
jgi:DNA-binding response OmpR family regulator